MAKRVEVVMSDELHAALTQVGRARSETVAATMRRLCGDAVLATDQKQAAAVLSTAAARKPELRVTDPRHGLVRALIEATYKRHFGLDCPWGAEESGQLGLLLRANPSWTLPQIRSMVENRFLSEGVTGERPMYWLKDLPKYIQGPLDRFGKALAPPEPVVQPTPMRDGWEFKRKQLEAAAARKPGEDEGIDVFEGRRQ